MAVAVSKTDSGSDDVSSLTTKTLSGNAIGTAAGDRLVFFGANINGLSSAVSISSCTIGGVTATAASAAFDPTSIGGGTARMQFWWALVPTGTTATVVVNFSGLADSTSEISWVLYRIVGADTTSPINSAAVTSTGSAPLSASLTIPANGCGIGLGDTSSGSTVSWTNLTEDVDAAGLILGQRYSSASSASAGAATRTFTSAGGGVSAGLYMIAIKAGNASNNAGLLSMLQ